MNNWNNLYVPALILLSVLILLCVLRAILGPRPADRLIAVNMVTTLVIIGICVLSLYLGEGYLTDVALLLSLLGCLGTVVLTRALREKARKIAAEGKERESRG